MPGGAEDLDNLLLMVNPCRTQGSSAGGARGRSRGRHGRALGAELLAICS